MVQDAEQDPNSTRVSYEEMHKRLFGKFPSRKEGDELDIPSANFIGPLDPQTVRKILSKMKKSAATAIDGWTRNHLMNAITLEGSIAVDIGVICSWLVSSYAPNPEQRELVHFDQFTLEMVRAARLIGIPKDDNGVRPIVISSFFSKLTGSVLLRNLGNMKLQYQYGINHVDGARYIGHKLRAEYEKGRCIIRFDVSNAFNEASRKRILELMKEIELNQEMIA